MLSCGQEVVTLALFCLSYDWHACTHTLPHTLFCLFFIAIFLVASRGRQVCFHSYKVSWPSEATWGVLPEPNSKHLFSPLRQLSLWVHFMYIYHMVWSHMYNYNRGNYYSFIRWFYIWTYCFLGEIHLYMSSVIFDASTVSHCSSFQPYVYISCSLFWESFELAA